jgi:fumarate hydratase class II
MNANDFAAIGSQDIAVNVSGALKTIAVALMKISNDLRWMNSGRLANLGEIALPESFVMEAAQVIGNDLAISIGGQASNLNSMLCFL